MDTTTPRSRRALIGAAVGGLGAIVAQALGRPVPASAGGQAILLGAVNTTDSPDITRVERSDGKARISFVASGYGAIAQVENAGAVGLVGYATSGASTGVRGRTDGVATQIAVDGDVTLGAGNGYAVRGRAGNGIGVYASATGGLALQVEGRAVFSRSGKVTFTAGQATRSVTAITIAADTLVVATIQGNVAGTWVRGVSVSDANDTFTIRLNKPAPKALVVGWFLVN